MTNELNQLKINIVEMDGISPVVESSKTGTKYTKSQ
jgi:hypothetical protein